MALSRIGKCQNLAVFSHSMGLEKFNRPAFIKSAAIFGEINHLNEARTKGFHFSKVRQYPEAPTLNLPRNVSEIFSNETGRFTPERIRDIYSSSIENHISSKSQEVKLDLRVASYDCFGAVSLNSSMQTNVPKPFNSSGKSNYLNMPGGQWARDGKYIAEDMQKSHYKCQLLKLKKTGFSRNSIFLNLHSRNYSTQTSTSESKPKTENSTITKKEKFKIMIKDYGKTIVVFHVVISLISLGGCYVAVSSGIDMNKLISVMTNDSNEMMQKIMMNSSTFAVAYGIHKLFAPVRLMITMSVAPIMVKFLRKKGILRHPEIAKKLKEAKLKAAGEN